MRREDLPTEGHEVIYVHLISGYYSTKVTLLHSGQCVHTCYFTEMSMCMTMLSLSPRPLKQLS